MPELTVTVPVKVLFVPLRTVTPLLLAAAAPAITRFFAPPLSEMFPERVRRLVVLATALVMLRLLARIKLVEIRSLAVAAAAFERTAAESPLSKVRALLLSV